MKRENPPFTPFKRKARGKETIPGSLQNPSKTARVRERVCEGIGRYRLAGGAADEIVEILGGNPQRDRGTWAYYCYHHDIEILLDKACECASRARQGEIKNAVKIFQKWLSSTYGKEAV